jgi:hypothetical protein
MQTITKIKSLIIISAGVFLSLPAQAYAASSCKKIISQEGLEKCVEQNKIVADLRLIINALSIGVGIIIVTIIILGGIQYMVAGDNPNAVSAAKQRIINALIALLAYILIFAFLQWLVPGGVFRG